MTSTGNDIVSLAIIDAARTKQHKFYSKIISGAEKALYDDPGFEAIPFEVFVWLLWSIKESAYKFLTRTDPELVFTPIRFEVKQIKIPIEFNVIEFVADNTTGVRKINVAAEIPSLGRGAAGGEVAGRGFSAILDDGNHLERLPEQFAKPLPSLPKGMESHEAAAFSNLPNTFADTTEGTGFDGKPAFKGLISIGGDTLFSRSLICNKAIMTVVNDSDSFDQVFWGVKKIGSADHETQSSEVRFFLLDRLYKVMNMDNLSIAKNEKGIPVLLASDKEIAIPASLSHHGHLIAYSFQTGDH